MEDMNNVSIQGDQRYINYKFDLFTVPVLVATFPIIYLVPTVFIIFKVFKVFWGSLFEKRMESLNPHVFLVIVVSQLTSILYMISDYLTIRIPFTGAITSWCAIQQPNHFLKILFFLSIYFTFTSWLFPSLLSTLRVISIYFPQRQKSLSARISKYAIPFIYVYPFIFSFSLAPALGFCRQLLGPYQFGAIYIWFSGNWMEIKIVVGFVLNMIFWLILCTLLNLFLYRKLKKMSNHGKSATLQRAEYSLTLTTFSMLLSYITNLACALMFIIFPSMLVYFIALRPFGNDCETVFVPWVFYLTHPIFKKKQKIGWSGTFNLRTRII
ncbi:Serpentine Receptor, class U [Caenorhabditis elegans]|uniref:Serpentine Receptor, class U n=1 Tax=Caenorhabditis elegans TaxID=6239 RepID=O62472_CAEEL|nr:Serpentine Receptor, class U [Caenorhabditis elegans]CAA16358.2 Serpentine Receptor, class U [Caenorhabditis elegans]|eukprot:NP_502618.2 Serpentine Receptor, class U [Caenorhabditis elegans]